MGLISRVSSRTYRNQKSQTKNQKWDDVDQRSILKPLPLHTTGCCQKLAVFSVSDQTPDHTNSENASHWPSSSETDSTTPSPVTSAKRSCKDERKLPIDLRHQRPIHRPPNHRRRSFLQTLPSQESLRRKEQRSIPRHTRRTIHPIPKPRLQSRRHHRTRPRLQQNLQLGQIRHW